MLRQFEMAQYALRRHGQDNAGLLLQTSNLNRPYWDGMSRRRFSMTSLNRNPEWVLRLKGLPHVARHSIGRQPPSTAAIVLQKTGSLLEQVSFVTPFLDICISSSHTLDPASTAPALSGALQVQRLRVLSAALLEAAPTQESTDPMRLRKSVSSCDIILHVVSTGTLACGHLATSLKKASLRCSDGRLPGPKLLGGTQVA